MRISLRNDSRLSGEGGAVVIFFGLTLVGLLAMIALVVDLGNTRQVKRQLQSAADAAALAGANSLGGTDYCTAAQGATPGIAPVTAAANYTFNNLRLSAPSPTSSGSCSTGGTWNYSYASQANLSVKIMTPYTVGAYSTSKLLRVEACKDVPTTFAKVIGVSTVHVCVHATALKTGAQSGGGTGTGGGTGSTDPDQPCAIDDFLANGYFDGNSAVNAQNDPTADSSHSGGPPGGPAGENKVVGATFYSLATDVDLTTAMPYFYVLNVTSGVKTTYTYVADNNPANFHIHAMTQVKPLNVPLNAPPGKLYQISWKIPSGLPNNSAYSIGMGVNDTNPLTHASCGRTTWSFTKGTVPAGAPGSVCGEDAFLNTLYPANGIAVPGNYVGANYQDESILNVNPGFQVDFRIDKGTANEIILRAPGTGDATHPEYRLDPGPTGKEKYSTLIQYQLPASMANGSHTVYLKAYDGDQNASGGDCGIGNWSFTLSGGQPVSANVKLVE